MNEIEEKILNYLVKVGEATHTEILNGIGLGKNYKSKLSGILKNMVNEGVLKITRQEGRTKYYALARPFQGVSESDENHVIIPKDITTITGIRAFIRGALNQNNWHSTSYDLPLMALLISKYTNLRLIVFGSQYVGKTTCIKGSVQHGHL